MSTPLELILCLGSRTAPSITSKDPCDVGKMRCVSKLRRSEAPRRARHYHKGASAGQISREMRAESVAEAPITGLIERKTR